jgi:hypothetical protein
MKLHREKYSGDFIPHSLPESFKKIQGYEQLEKVTLDAHSRPLPPRPGVLNIKQRKHSKEPFSRTKLVFKKIHLCGKCLL